MILEFVIEHRLEFIHHLLSSKVEGRVCVQISRVKFDLFFFFFFISPTRVRYIKLIDIIYIEYLHTYLKVKYKVKYLEGIAVERDNI